MMCNSFSNLHTILYKISKIGDAEEFLTAISHDSEYGIPIKDLSNDMDSIIVNTKNNNIPTGTILKIYVGDKLKDGAIENIYYYNKDSNELELVKGDAVVENGYVEFPIAKGTDYLIERKVVKEPSDDAVPPYSKKSIISTLVFILVLLILMIIIASVIILKKNKKKKDYKTGNSLSDLPKISNNSNLDHESSDDYNSTQNTNTKDN